jgi:hypothetical protein
LTDLGPPSSYLALEAGTPVLSSDGSELGAVEHVLADEDADVFDGVVLDTSVLPGGHRFVDASQIAEIRERGVVLALDAAAAERLPEPSANPAVMEADPGDATESELTRKLRSAWDRISGNY